MKKKHGRASIKRSDLQTATKAHRRHLASEPAQEGSFRTLFLLGIVALGTVMFGAHSLRGLVEPVRQLIVMGGGAADLDRAILSLVVPFLLMRLFCLPSMLNHTRIDRTTGSVVEWVGAGKAGIQSRGLLVGIFLAVPEGILLALGVRALALLPCTQEMMYTGMNLPVQNSVMSFPLVLWFMQFLLILLSHTLTDYVIGPRFSRGNSWNVFLRSRRDGCAGIAAAVLLEAFVYIPLFVYVSALNGGRPYASATAIAGLMIARVVGVLGRDTLSVFLDSKNDRWVSDLLQALSGESASDERTEAIDQLVALGRSSAVVKSGLVRLRKKSSDRELTLHLDTVLDQI